MKVWFKRNKSPACYDPSRGYDMAKPEPQLVEGPFSKCKGCNYAGHGFLCHAENKMCLRDIVTRMSEKERVRC